MEPLYPYFGGKRMITGEVWKRLGKVQRYIEPFAGGLAVMLANPNPPKIETINDMCGYVVNFWRAIKAQPDEVAKHADRIHTELDLFAANKYLIENVGQLEQDLRGDIDYYCPKIAGLWWWGSGLFIGSKWGQREETQTGKLSCALKRNISAVQKYAKRFEGVKITCGDFQRVLTSTPVKEGVSGATGIFLDPPYISEERDEVYRNDTTDLKPRIMEVCNKWGDDEKVRIALCGYDGEYDLPGWKKLRWKANGGYGNNGNEHRETIWFSPHCEREHTLFD